MIRARRVVAIAMCAGLAAGLAGFAGHVSANRLSSAVSPATGAGRARTDGMDQAASSVPKVGEEAARISAAQTLLAARGQAERAASDSATAQSAYEDAARNWRWMAYVVMVAATWDMAGEVCAGVESTQQYRKRMGLVGDRATCVDHGLAHALGGVNHEWNYAPIDCGLNSSYGASFWGKLGDMPVEVLRGLAATALARLRCGSAASAWRR